MKLILDGMGGDNAPVEIVKGACEAIKLIPHDICIVGDEEQIKAELDKNGYSDDKTGGGRITVVHASQTIDNCDAPVKAVRTKKDSSMVVGLNMVKKGEGDIFFSAGNTGALLAGGLFILGRIQGIDRPALATVYPAMDGKNDFSLLLDAGANAECKPNNLLEFGVMGSIYMEKVMGKQNPRVALANIGVEESKGTSQIKLAYDMLQKTNLNFIGNVEARDIPTCATDVIVCDGFVGNTIVKLTEGVALNLFKAIKGKITSGFKATLGTLLIKDKLYALKDEFDYSEYGGAPFLGVKAPLIKMHGSSEARAVKNALVKSIPFAQNNVIGVIENAVLDIEEIINSEE